MNTKMMRRLAAPFALLLGIIALGLVLPLGRVGAQLAAPLPQVSCTTGNYLWCKRQVTGIPPSAESIRLLLRDEIQGLISAGHLAPARIMIGEWPVLYAWGNPADVVYALAAAYPYFASDPILPQASIQAYMDQEMQSYPLWNVGFKDSNQGTNPDPYLVGQRESVDCYSGKCDPKLWNLYALWLYAENTGNWNSISTNWTSINSLYTALKNTSAPTYEDLAGVIGVARMAQHIGQTSDAATLASNWMSTLSSFATGRTNSRTRYNLGSWVNFGPLPYAEIEDSGDPTCPGNRPPVLFHLTPEIARFIDENGSLRADAIAYFNDIESLQPGWFVNKANFDWKVFPSSCGTAGANEDATFPPVYLSWMFPTQAWVVGGFTLPGDQLKPLVDGPYNPVGDLDYLNRLVTWYEAYGVTSWCDVTGGGCSGGAPSPTPGPATSTPTPQPATATAPITHAAKDLARIPMLDWRSSVREPITAPKSLSLPPNM